MDGEGVVVQTQSSETEITGCEWFCQDCTFPPRL